MLSDSVFFVMKKNALTWRNFSTSCLVVNSPVFLDMRTKLRPLLRTGFSAFEIGRFSGIVTTVWWFWFSRGAAFYFRGFVMFSSLFFFFSFFSKWWKSLELRACILVWIDCSKTEGHTLESWERHSIICLFSSLRFEHMALFVLLIMFCENLFWVR